MNLRHSLIGAVAALAFAGGAAQADEVSVVHAGHLMAKPGKGFVEARSVIIRNGRVEAVLPTADFAKPALTAGDDYRV